MSMSLLLPLNIWWMHLPNITLSRKNAKQYLSRIKLYHNIYTGMLWEVYSMEMAVLASRYALFRVMRWWWQMFVLYYIIHLEWHGTSCIPTRKMLHNLHFPQRKMLLPSTITCTMMQPFTWPEKETDLKNCPLFMHKLRNNQLVDVSAVVTDSVKTAQNRNA